MKRNAVFRIIAWTVTLVILAGLLIFGMSWRYKKIGSLRGLSLIDSPVNPSDTVAAGPQSSAESYLYQAGGITDIKVDWLAGSIRITPSENVQGIEVRESEVSDARYKMVCRQDGSTLKIAYCETTLRNAMGMNPLKKDLTIVVPKDFSLRELEIDAASAELSVQDLTIRDVSVDTASGESKFTNCAVETLDVDTASGNIRFEGSLGKLDCDSASAGVQAVLTNVPREIDMDTASGSVELTLPEDAGFSVKMDTMSGKFDSSLSYTVENKKYVRGDKACEIDISSMSGDVTIRSR